MAKSSTIYLIVIALLTFSIKVVWTSGPVHISGGRTSKSEIRKQKSQIILADGESFNEVDERSNIGPITIDKRVIRGQMISTKVNRQDTEPDYSPDILDNNLMLPFFPEEVTNVTVKVGQNAHLECKVENLNSYKVAWVRVDTQTILTIHNNVITRNPRISLSRPSSNQWFLHLQRVLPADRGWYMCQINTDPMIHRSGYFEVQVPPLILQKDENADIVAREGDNVTLACDAKGHPTPQIVWRREDKEDILVNGRKVSAVESSRLHLTKISRLQMGDYLCVATNGVNPSTSMKYKTRVQFPPMFWIPSQLEGAWVGQDVTIECHSEAYPHSINYWVKKDGVMLLLNEKYETKTIESGYKRYMKLRIRNVQPEDFMEYRCVAKNSLGGSDGTITLYEVKPPTTTTTTTTTTPPTTTRPRKPTKGTRKARRRKHRNKKYRDSQSHTENGQFKEHNGAGKFVEDHISVRIEEEQETIVENINPRNSGCQMNLFLSNFLASLLLRPITKWIQHLYFL